jgi:asparagine synthase (glutamine-hydrolysing)
MCGIFALLNSTINTESIKEFFMKGSHRGPDYTNLVQINNSLIFGFHRLAINGLTAMSNQPFCLEGVYLICNGEIYNYKSLFATLGITPTTNSDCEIILHLYHTYGIEQTLHMIDASEFAFILYDSNKNVMYAARDPYGVRPLFQGRDGTSICFASELKMIPSHMQITTILPGTFVDDKTNTYCSLPSINHSLVNPNDFIYKTLYECVRKRVEVTDRPMACLLSGGLDSSLIATLVSKCRQEMGIKEALETYSIGLEGSEDLKYATIMAKFLGSKHTNIVVSESDFLNAIPEVIYAIESCDTTTVRASVGNYLIAKYIKDNSKAKVIFNGDGADEVCGGYLYLKLAPNCIEFDKECRRLVKDIHYFDALRSDRCISSHGLEARTPFLDRAFVEAYLSIPPTLRFTGSEKELLRKAFFGVLPNEILWRKKEAFSDGVSSLQKPWYSIIQDHIATLIQDYDETLSMEQYYYKKIYDSKYSVDLRPYYWMPKYTDAKDCSARTLKNY